MATKYFLDQITVPSPCTKSWDNMIGNDQVRFCEHCSLSVQNLSEMTRKQASRLIAKSKGRLCVRYIRRPDGSLVHVDGKRRLHRIRRRISRAAAGSFSATLTVTGAAAQNSQPTECNKPGITAEAEPHAGMGVIFGVVKDQNDAVITSASVSITNDETGLALYTSVTSAGEFRFEALDPG